MENLKKFCKEKSITFFFPVALILTIVPLIVRARKLKNVGTETLDLFGPAKTQTDLFSQNKAIVLMFFSIILLLLSVLCFKYIFKKKDKIINSVVILAFAFLMLSLLSSIFSSYKSIAFWGIFDRSEGFITIACYILLFIYSIYTFKTSNDYKCILIPIMIVVFINAFIGIFQFTGHDLLKTGLGVLFSNVDPNGFGNSNAGHIYGTMYHYNYIGSFAALVIPILILSFFFIDDIFLKLCILAASLNGFWLLFGSTSRAGIIGVCCSIIFAIIIFGKQLIKNIKPIGIVICTLLAISIGINFATGNKLFKRIPSLVQDGLSVFQNTSDFDYKEHIAIKNIIHEGKNIKLDLPSDDSLTISFENNKYKFTNSTGENIEFNEQVDTKSKSKTTALTTTDERYSNFSFRYGPMISKTRNDGLILFLNNQNACIFMLKEDGTIHMINGYSHKEIELDNPETFGFKGKEKLASARGYIWSRSIPLLKDCVLLGKGPDTFAFYFPQNDLLGKLYAYDVTYETVDKPHNLYIQTAFSNGIVSLIVFLIIMIIYITDSLKIYALKKSHTEKELMGIANLLAIIGYLGAGIFNDSRISIAPIFWVVLGTGFALNYLNKQSLNK